MVVHISMYKYAVQLFIDHLIKLKKLCRFVILFWQAEDFLLAQSLCRLAFTNETDEEEVLKVFINATAVDSVCVGYLLNNIELIKRCMDYCQVNNEHHSTNAAKLLSNLSLHLPEKVVIISFFSGDAFYIMSMSCVVRLSVKSGRLKHFAYIANTETSNELPPKDQQSRLFSLECSHFPDSIHHRALTLFVCSLQKYNFLVVYFRNEKSRKCL
ncbi:unnamed protein product [Thelazia callipaeda]|uniref:ANK_REP_REGION domain-containing protein n=1 Tax=Thelazia callipaeda TaxID=103827 RepID=A0A0N5CZV8_THECL|nr:unnamed protein product [Thelazia callipaeda]